MGSLFESKEIRSWEFSEGEPPVTEERGWDSNPKVEGETMNRRMLVGVTSQT